MCCQVGKRRRNGDGCICCNKAGVRNSHGSRGSPNGYRRSKDCNNSSRSQSLSYCGDSSSHSSNRNSSCRAGASCCSSSNRTNDWSRSGRRRHSPRQNIHSNRNGCNTRPRCKRENNRGYVLQDYGSEPAFRHSRGPLMNPGSRLPSSRSRRYSTKACRCFQCFHRLKCRHTPPECPRNHACLAERFHAHCARILVAWRPVLFAGSSLLRVSTEEQAKRHRPCFHG